MSNFDLYAELIENTTFQKSIQEKSDRLQQAEREFKAGTGTLQAIQAPIQDILKTCHYNPALLTPHFFPAYPRDVPLSLLARPFMVEMFKFQIGGFTVYRAGRQVGKCVSAKTKVTVEINGTTQTVTSASLFTSAKANADTSLLDC